MKETLTQFVAALNYTSQYAHQYKIYSAIKLQQHIYYQVRGQFGLKSQMTINCFRKVAGTYKAKKNGTQILFTERSMTLNYPRDYKLTGANTLSINTLNGRQEVTFQIGDHQRQYLDDENWTILSANLKERRDGKIFLYIAIEKQQDKDALEPSSPTDAIGVDVGMNFIAVTSDTANKTLFYGGGGMKYTRWKYFMLRQGLQSKGTRSAKRKLKIMSGRERRFVTDKNHCIAKKIVQDAKTRFQHPVIVLEDLTNIRVTVKSHSKSGKRNLNNWSFYQLQQFIEYKAAEQGIPVMYIPPAYTSQTCPKCGHRAKANRNKKLHWFTCKKCNYQTNDDRAASMNIRNRAVVPRHVRGTQGASQSSLSSASSGAAANS